MDELDSEAHLSPEDEKAIEKKLFAFNGPVESSKMDFESLTIHQEDMPDHMDNLRGIQVWHNLVRFLAYHCPHRLPSTYARDFGPLSIYDGSIITLNEWVWEPLARDYAACCNVLQDLVREQYGEAKAQFTSRAHAALTSDDDAELPPPLTEHEVVVLRVLLDAGPERLLTLPMVQEACKDSELPSFIVSEKTAGKSINRFVKLGLAERPRGDKNGVRLTRRGREFAKTLLA